MKKYFLTIFTLISPFLTFAQETVEKGLDQRIDEGFKPFSDAVFNTIFFPVFGIPFVLILLVFSALFFTIYFGFPNIKYFGKAINTVRGKYDEIEGGHKAEDTSMTIDGDIRDTIRDESQEGEVSHFQALATAVSGTVGNGNIAGVALAIALGGPGATFWMIICGLLGMSSKFVECTLGVQYRDVGEDGTVYGGPMYYISKGLKEKGFATLGKVAAAFFAIFCIGGSFGGGNAAQSNQATIVLKDLLGLDNAGAGFWIGVILAVLVGIIIIGGIKRIASVTEKVVPFMAVFYLLACLYIIFSNFSLVDDAIGLIFTEAFNPTAIGVGSLIGVLLVGFKRAAFSNEAGAGSASIAHSAVKTNYSASEGLVALLEPFIDTVVICTMTALVIIIFNFGGAFQYGGDGLGAVMIDGISYEGAGITSKAFAQYIPYSNVFLTIAVVLFAVSTMISWSYYGLQSWKFLFGRGKAADLAYKLLFLLFVIIGAAASMGSIWQFSDAMIFAMIFPNMIGLFFLFPVVKKQLKRYLGAIKAAKA
ncbi:alanine/glycine:cation symporter family protein [Flavivirga jejuensis]|uniref:Alanine/glycine:cation symporter family protein n=1 Tax=Flavivirga jejuensis TaxID=870487 RepID=A0ABT8WKS0_9FLAO|nr:alanine/glycine:cation symporter family protein [Flavivirga jejuensis]MDO5973584.1 alanine/glycine:cation symporter family protein [Flavivirga jejuensis]